MPPMGKVTRHENLGKALMGEEKTGEFEGMSEDEKIVRDAEWPTPEMVTSKNPEAPPPEPAKRNFEPAHKKVFKVVKQMSLDKREESNILEGLAKHPRSGVREVKSEILVEEDVFATTTTVITKEKTERATGLVPKKIEQKPFVKGEINTRKINPRKLRLWGGGSLSRTVKQGPKIEPKLIQLTANLIHWQVEQNEKIAIKAIDKASVFSAEDIQQNREGKIEIEKKKTEELFKLEEIKKERERVAANQMPLVWDGAEWVFEDEFARKKEEARIAKEEAMLKAEEERQRKKEEEERRKKEEALKAEAKLKLDFQKKMEEEEAKKKAEAEAAKAKVEIRATSEAKKDLFEKGPEAKEKVQVTDEMFMTEEQIAEKKRKFEEQKKLRQEEDEARAKLSAEEQEAARKREEAALAEGKRQEELEAERIKRMEEEKAKKAQEEALEEEEEERLEREKRAKIDDEFAEKMKKIEEESKIVITPAILKAKEKEEEEEDPSKPKKKITDVFTERAEKKKPEGQKVSIRPKDLSKMQSKFVKVDLPVDEGPVRRKKKPVDD